MYWKTFEPLQKDEIKEFKIYPDGSMDKELYLSKYKGRKKKIRKYLMFSKHYEYLAFSYKLQKLKLPDTLGYFWTEKWIKDLLLEDEFRDVHNYYKEYYPELTKFIENQSNQQDF
jgi:hypothetical protein